LLNRRFSRFCEAIFRARIEVLFAGLKEASPTTLSRDNFRRKRAELGRRKAVHKTLIPA